MKSPRPRVKKQRLSKSLSGKKILLIVSGSIAAYKTGDLIHDLKTQGASVTCVMTECAKHFVTPLVLRALSGHKVYEDFFSSDTPYDVLHTSLAEEHDVILAAPASANFLARLAAGMANDLASCIVLATRKPVLLAPAMNDQMYRHMLTQANLKKLKGAGYQIIEPIEGHLVCGKEAVGHISDSQTVIGKIRQVL